MGAAQHFDADDSKYGRYDLWSILSPGSLDYSFRVRIVLGTGTRFGRARLSESPAAIVGVGGFCLDVQGSVATEGAPILYVPCNGGPSRNWSVSNGSIVGIGGKCIDVQGGVPYDQAPLILSTCSGGPTQQWAVH